MRRTSMFPAMTAVPEARAPPSPTARATVEESLIRLTPHVSSRSALVGLLRDHGESAAIVAAALHAVSDSKAAAEPGEEELINAAVLAHAGVPDALRAALPLLAGKYTAETVDAVLRGATSARSNNDLFETAVASVATGMSAKKDMLMATPIFSELLRRSATDSMAPARLADLAGGSLARLSLEDATALPAAAAKCVLVHAVCACDAKRPCAVAAACVRLITRLGADERPEVKAAATTESVKDALDEFDQSKARG